MQRTFTSIARSFRHGIFLFITITLIGISGLFVFTATPSFASTNNSQTIQPNSPNSSASQNIKPLEQREEAYEKTTEAIQEPGGLKEIYEEHLKNSENPQPNGIVQAAKDLVETVTGQK